MILDDYKPVGEGTKIGKILAWSAIAVAGIALASLIFWAAKSHIDRGNKRSEIAAEIKTFDNSIDQYIVPSAQLAYPPDDRLYANGKVIVVNRFAKAVDDIHYELPDDVRAASPEEVGTIVWLDWGRRFVGQYMNGTVGYAHAVRVSVIDKSTMALIDSRIMIGSNPPRDTEVSGEVYGARPVRKIVAHIRGVKEGKIVDVPNEAPPMNASSRSMAGRFIGYAMLLCAGVLASWWGTRQLKRKMSKRLGRDVHGEHELTSITSWIEASRRDDSSSKR